MEGLDPTSWWNPSGATDAIYDPTLDIGAAAHEVEIVLHRASFLSLYALPDNTFLVRNPDSSTKPPELPGLIVPIFLPRGLKSRQN